MKTCKKMLLLAVLFGTGTSIAQEKKQLAENVISSKYPTIGAIMVEVNLKPFGSDKVISFDNFQTKYWLSDQTVLRLGLNINNQANSQSKDDYVITEQHPYTAKENSLQIGVLPGIEYHFLKNKKISPYAGVELSFSNRNSSSEYESYSINSYINNVPQYTYYKYNIDGAWMGSTTSSYISNGSTYYYTNTNYTNQRSFSSYGANLLLGSDFYFVKNMYFGFEVGLGYKTYKYRQIEVERTDLVDKTNIPSFSASTLNFYYNSAIRLGIWF